MENIKTIAIIGGGVMGRGIAQLLVQNGLFVIVIEAVQDTAEKIMPFLQQTWARQVKRGRFTTEEVNSFVQQITVTTEMSALKEADVVIEAITEILEAKQSALRQAEKLVAEKILFVSNTSTLSITSIAAGLKNPERLVGMHFFNPPVAMKLVEVVVGLQSCPENIDRVTRLAEEWGKVVVKCKSFPGFIVNRVSRPFYCEAFTLLEEGVGSIAEIDIVASASGIFPMGPFALVDLIGVDTNYRNTCSLFAAYYQDKRYKPSITQLEYLNAGYTGKKNGKGLYTYQGGTPKEEKIAFVSITNHSLPKEAILSGSPNPHLTLARMVNFFRDQGVRVKSQKAQNASLSINGYVLFDSSGLLAQQEENIRPALILDWTLSEKAQVVAVSVNQKLKQEQTEEVAYFLSLIGFQTLLVPDTPGMLVQRLVCLIINEALAAIGQGVCNDIDCDLALKLGMNYKRQPIEIAAEVGYGKIIAVLENLFEIFKDEKYRPALTLRKRALLHENS